MKFIVAHEFTATKADGTDKFHRVGLEFTPADAEGWPADALQNRINNGFLVPVAGDTAQSDDSTQARTDEAEARIGQLIAAAQEHAAQLVSDAEAQAVKIVAAAQAEATQIVSDAQADAGELEKPDPVFENMTRQTLVDYAAKHYGVTISVNQAKANIVAAVEAAHAQHKAQA